MGSKIASVALLLTLFPVWSMADEAPIVPEDVSQESVTPRFDSPEVVKNRLLSFAGRMEVSLSQGWILDEPYLNNNYQALSLSYSLSEFHAGQIKYLNYNSGTSNYAKIFNSSFGLSFDKVPNPSFGLLFGHQYRFSYGKISFSQNLTVPTTLELQSEIGFNQQAGKKMPVLSAGIMQKTYFTPQFSFGLSYHWLIHQSIDATSANLPSAAPVAEDQLKTKTEFSHTLNLIFGYLF